MVDGSPGLDGCLGVGMDVWTDVKIRVKFRPIRGTKILEANFVKLEAKLYLSEIEMRPAVTSDDS
jgi:hypothetical protein